MKTGKTPTQTRALSPPLQKLDQKLRQASQLYEKQFLRQMVKAMRDSVSHSALTKPGMAESIYREQLDEKYVDHWLDRGGTGFSEIIYKDLVEKFYPMLGPQRVKKLRPVSLSDRYQGMSRSITQKKEKKQIFHLQLKPQGKGGSSALSLPWKGQFEKAFELGGGQKGASFSHGFGLKSTFVFQGQLKPGLLGKTLWEGETFAQIGPASQIITWQIEPTNPHKGPSGGKKNSFN